MKPSPGMFDDVARWLGVTITPHQRALLIEFEGWLGAEAIRSGGIGPREIDRLWDRHILDSFAYIRGIPADATTIVDVGGGVGLPAIPLAIARPDLTCLLVDRSERRVWSARRAIRILELDNIEVAWQDIDTMQGVFDVATFRASLPMTRAAVVTKQLIDRSGVGLFGVSRRKQQPDVPSAPDGISFALSSEGAGVLDTPFWLLRMTLS